MSVETTTLSLADAKKLLTIVPFFVEEYDEKFWPTEVMETYSKRVSPFFSTEVVTTDPIPTSIEAISLAVPTYLRSSSTFYSTRDPAEINVHSALQNEFWQTLFRDAFGTEANSLIIAAFNRLRYVYATEENLLFSSVFKQLLTTDNESEMILPLDAEDDANVALVKEKLQAAYAILNYEAVYSSFIDSWLDSMYLSGQLSLAEKVHEANVYAAQDIKAELLKRKFAGTASLYSIILSSINRRGTYAPTVALKTVYSDSNFKDSRAIRALDLPGITTNTSNILIDPLSAFEGLMPLRTITPLYYTSSNYDSDVFTQNKENYLRYRASELAWDNIRGILDSSLVKQTYPRFDQMNPNTVTYDINLDPNAAPHSGLYSMDSEWLDPVTTLMRPAILDDSQPLFNLSIVTSGFFDIQADQLLFHENTVQKARRHEYPFAIYNISSGTGPCMMDIPWLDYIDRSISKKKRVQEKVGIGVQISRYANISATDVEEAITIITFSEEFESSFDAQAASYTPSMKYAYLWNLRIFYNISSFVVSELRRELLTYVMFATDTTGYSAEAITLLSQHPSYADFTGRSVGLLPFAYPNLRTNTILSLEMSLSESAIRDDFYEEEYNKAVFLFTPYENVAIAKRYIKSHPGVLTAAGSGPAEWYVAPSNDEALKHMIYGIERQNEASGEYEWFWSDPMRLYPKALANITTLHPDWMNMVMYVNPYLSFTKECSSPIRRRETLTRGLRPIDLPDFPLAEAALASQIGPGADTALGNLNVVHAMEYYCNHTGGETAGDNYPQGSYLKKIRPISASIETESFQIWGDNRATGTTAYTDDPLDKWSEGTVRSTQFGDTKNVPCLYFAEGAAYVEDVAVDSYYLIAPSKTAIVTADWADWQWNSTDNSGFTTCIDLQIEDKDVDQWLLSRNESTVADVHAEFDFYFAANHELTLKIYPEGTVAGTVFSVVLNAEHILGKQSQIAASYLTEVGADANELRITLSIVADRKWVTRRYVTTYTSATSHELYSDVPEDFDLTGITPVTITLSGTYDYTAGYIAPDVYRFGKLQKYQAQATNKLGSLCLLNYRYGLKPMRGLLYDFRLQKQGVNAMELLVLAAGTRRELYSYSPILYKLAYQYFSDPGVLKRARRAGTEVSENIGRVRIFQRSIWDSIITDLYPMSAAEADPLSILYREDWQDPLDDPDIYDGMDYVDGVVEQLLVPNYETMSDVTLGSTNLFYKGQAIETSPTTKHSFIQTSIYPMKYKQESFSSGLTLVRDTGVTPEISFKAYHFSNPLYQPSASARPAELPSVPSGDTLEYRLSLDLNFFLGKEIDAAAPISFGSNLAIEKDSAFSSNFVIKHSVPTVKAVASNYLTYPLYIPSQGANEYSVWSGTFTGFEISNFRLNHALSSLLDANSYYGEYQVPYAYDDDAAPLGSSYTSRWSAVKGMRDGEYYVTCKYPVQVRPLLNHEMATAKDLAILYASTRLKIVVSSRPVSYIEASTENYEKKWDSDGAFIPKLFESTDNMTFPHRIVEIDLYAMRNAGSEIVEDWHWYKIASNHDSTSGIQSLADISAEIAISNPLSFYFSRNFTAPFFVQGATSSDVVTDLTYMKIENSVHGTENLRATTLADLDPATLTLLSARSYKLLMDYSANITEVSFSADIFTDTTVTHEELGSDELANYTKLTSLLDDAIFRDPFLDASYSGGFDWSGDSAIDLNLSATKTGYAINSSGEFIAANTDIGANNLSLGDPYSNALTKNLLVEFFESRRAEVAELFYFTYRQEDISIDTVIPPRLFGSRVDSTTTFDIQIIKRTPENTYILAKRKFDEYSSLKSFYTKKIGSIATAIKSLRNSSGGILSSFASIDPTYSSNVTLQEEITPSTHTLKAFAAGEFPIALTSPIVQTLEGLYATNLIQSQDFTDTNYYVASPLGASHGYVYDSTKARDVFSLHTATGTSASLQYVQDPGASSQYENAISIKTPVAIEVAVQYTLFDKTIWTSSYTTVNTLNTWIVPSWETPGAVDPIKITILFRKPASAAFANEEILISKLFLRRARSYSHNLGFSEAVIAGTSTAIALGSVLPTEKSSLQIVFMREGLGTLYPLQLRNQLLTAGEATFTQYTSFIAKFIQTYLPTSAKTSVTDIISLIRPWTRRIIFTEANPRNTLIYKLENAPGGAGIHYATSGNDIFKVDNDHALEEDRSIRYNAIFNDVEFAGSKGIVLDVAEADALCNSNLIVNTTELAVVEERFSLISGCVDPAKFLIGNESVVAITNIQLMDAEEDKSIVLYELEYFPIIYDETRHHLSLNFLLRAD